MDSFSDTPAVESAPRKDFPVVFVTGISGAGKSTALNVFEDLRFFTMDGLPATLVYDVTKVLRQDNMAHFEGLVIGVNMLQPGAVQLFKEELEKLNAEGIFPSILFVEAQTPVLVKRYATTRRPHPLESENLGLEQALQTENERLAVIREQADLVVDTSSFSIHDLRRDIQKRWQSMQERAHAMKIHLLSFGFKYGMPSDADMVFDLRFLPNPYFVPELKAMSGLDQPVADYVLKQDPGKTFLRRLSEYLLYLLPLFESEGRYRVTIAIGCTGGRHRSVAVTQNLGKILQQHGFTVSTEHKHLELG